MVNLDDSFISQHFENLYQFICHGPQGNQRYAMRKFNNRNYWEVEVSRETVMISIRRFLFLCKRADQISGEFSMIPRWINDLLIIACQPSKSHISDSYRYARLLESAEPITKFLLGSFDWNITDINPGSKYQTSYLEGFDSRIGYYRDRCKPYSSTAQILYILKNMRNEVAHTAKNFYENYHACMNMLVFTLYSYITIFHFLDNVCKEDDEPIRLKDDLCGIIDMPENGFLQITIKVELVDTESKHYKSADNIQVRLYNVDSMGNQHYIVSEGDPYKFKVEYFKTYQASIICMGIESYPSEKFTIGHDFANGTVIRIGIPPTGMKPAPIKISIKELVLGTDLLPGDVQWILERIEEYEPKSECLELAKLLTVGAVTNNQQIKEKYKQAIAELKQKLSIEVQKNKPENISEFLNMEMESFRTLLTLPYTQEEDFRKLCDSIDNLYGLIPDVIQDCNDRNIDQIQSNVEKFVTGHSFTMETSAINESKRMQHRLSSLKVLLEMKERYPDVVQAEELGFLEFLKDLHKNNANYNSCIRSLQDNILLLYDHVISRCETTSLGQYAYLALILIHGSTENVIQIIQSCSSDLIDLITKCSNDNKEVNRYINNCIERIREIRDSHLIIPSIVLDDADLREAEKIHSQLKNELNKLIMLTKTEADNLIYTDYLNFLLIFISNMSANSFVQIFSISRLLRRQILYSIKSSTECLDYTCKGEIINQCEQVFVQLWNRFNMLPRRREGDKFYSTRDEFVCAESSFIVDYSLKCVDTKYGIENVPSYINLIKNADDVTLPITVKAIMLYMAGKSNEKENELLIHLTKYAMESLPKTLRYQSCDFLLDIEEEFYKKYLVNEPFESFNELSLAAQQDFLYILLNSHGIGNIRNSKLFLWAVKLNFTNGKEIIPADDVFQSAVIERIEGMNYMEFFDYMQVVSLNAQYAERCKDTYTKAIANKMVEDFSKNAEYYYNQHIQYVPFYSEKKMDVSIIYDTLVKAVIKLSGKTNEEQLLFQYRCLFQQPYVANKNTSVWCELEKQLFHKIYILIQRETDEAQQNELSKQLLLIDRKNLCDDRWAEILLALAPFLDKQIFKFELERFYNEIRKQIFIQKTTVKERLQIIATLFDDYLYSMNIPGVSIGAPVNILMAIHDMLKLNS